MAAIAVRGLTKYYGAKRAVEDVTFEVSAGEIVGLLGPNGAGKTTIMRILAGYYVPTQGRAEVAGCDCIVQAMEVKRRLGYMPENPLLYAEMRVKDYLTFLCRLRKLPRAAWKERIQAVVEQMNLGAVRSTIIGKLSKGYRQRVGLAGAMIHDPEVLILDEPTVGLDPKQILEIRQLIKGLRGSKTVMLSSHILPEVQEVCGRIVVLNKGRIAAIDTKEELVRRLEGEDRLHVEVRGAGIPERVKGLPGVRAVGEPVARDGRLAFTVDCERGTDVREALFQLVVKEGGVLYELRPLGMSLEEVFLQLTREEGGA